MEIRPKSALSVVTKQYKHNTEGPETHTQKHASLAGRTVPPDLLRLGSPELLVEFLTAEQQRRRSAVGAMVTVFRHFAELQQVCDFFR